MKRFIGYLLLSLSILVSVFVGFVPTFKNVNAGADYAQGKEFIYQVALKDTTLNYINGTSSFKEEDTLENDIEDIITEFKSRLEKADISNAIVERIDNRNDDSQNEKFYSIRVAYKAQYEQLYSAINNYLTFDWNLSVSITKDPFNFSQYVDNTNTSKEFLFKRGEVTLDTSGALPVINIPLADPQKFNDDILKLLTDKNNKQSGTSTLKAIKPFEAAEEGTEENTPTTDDYIYVVNNWVDKYDIKKAIDDANYLTAAKNNIVFKLNTKDLSTVFADYDPNDTSKVCNTLKIEYNQFCPDLTNITDSAVLQRIINTFAKIEMNKLNSTSYKYDIKLLNENYPALNSSANGSNSIPAFVEQLKQNGTLVFSTLIIATISAFVLVALFLSLNFGVASLAGVTVGSATTLLSAALLSLFGVEFNIGTIVALLTVAIMSIFSSVIYFKKVREACYTGKNLKKANADASKKTLITHLDISVISLILGVVAYLNSNVIIMSMGAVLILGGIFNFIMHAIVLRGLYWLLANSSFINDHLKLLVIKKDLIPDLSKDEKPVYFDSFKGQKTSKKTKIISTVIFTILLVGSIIAIPVTNSLKGNIYGTPYEQVQDSQVYITYKVLENDESINGFATTTALEEKVLKKIYTFDQNAEGGKGKALKYTSVNSMYSSAVIDDAGNKMLSFTYIVKLSDTISNENLYIFEGNSENNASLNQLLESVIFTDLASEFEVSGINDLNVYLLSVSDFTDDNLNYDLLIFILISIAISTGYTLLRYGLGKAIISFLIVGGASTITIGIYSALAVGVASTNTLCLVLIALGAYSYLLYYYQTQKDLLKENKNIKFEANYLELRKELFETNHSMTFSSLIIILSLSALIIISFILSKTFANVVLISTLVGCCIALLLIKSFILELEELNAICWDKSKKLFNLDKFKKRDHKNNKDKDKGDGPQEATFIGIND